MLHSKIYYMEFADAHACAIVGSHNMTGFALSGLNGEAAVMLEGATNSSEFEKVRRHIAEAKRQAVIYTPALKDAYAWWTREFIDGLRAEIGITSDWETTRTILIFAKSGGSARPKVGDHIYFEIPQGIEQIESLKTEAHLFLFDTLPATPSEALRIAFSAKAGFTCTIRGAENSQGNREVVADWRIEVGPTPLLQPVPSRQYRPGTAKRMQQVRAEVRAATVDKFEYTFERKKEGWFPEFDDQPANTLIGGTNAPEANAEVGGRLARGWQLVTGLTAREGSTVEKDQAVLKLVAPESGSFMLVSLRRRRR